MKPKAIYVYLKRQQHKTVIPGNLETTRHSQQYKIYFDGSITIRGNQNKKQREDYAKFGGIEGTVKTLIVGKQIGFLTVDPKQMPKNFNGNDVLFEFQCTRNISDRDVKLEEGAKVKVVLHNRSQRQPKAFYVYVGGTRENSSRKMQNSVVFWDFDTCKVKRKNIQTMASQLKNYASIKDPIFMVSVNVDKESKETLEELYKSNVNIANTSAKSPTEIFKERLEQYLARTHTEWEVILISGNVLFTEELQNMEKKNVQTILFYNNTCKDELKKAADVSIPFEDIKDQQGRKKQSDVNRQELKASKSSGTREIQIIVDGILGKLQEQKHCPLDEDSSFLTEIATSILEEDKQRFTEILFQEIIEKAEDIRKFGGKLFSALLKENILDVDNHFIPALENVLKDGQTVTTVVPEFLDKLRTNLPTNFRIRCSWSGNS